MQVLTKADFTIIGVEKESKIYADLDIGIVKIIWKGTVDLKSAQGIMDICTDLIAEDLCTKIIVDRHTLLEFQEDALEWMEKAIGDKYGLLKEKVRKIATISSSGEITTSISAIDDMLLALKPEVVLHDFDSMQDADKWILNVA